MKKKVRLLILILAGFFLLSFSDCFNNPKGSSQNRENDSSKFMAQDSTIIELIKELESPDEEHRQEALARLIRHGSQAIPALTERMNRPGSPTTKELVMKALANIADSTSVALFKSSLKDDNPKVRALAAQGLVRIGHPDAMDALVATLFDYDDPLSPYTMSAYSLIAYGPKALPKVVPLLSDSSLYTREMAFDIIAQIVSRMPGYNNDWNELNEKLGNYDPAQNPDSNKNAIDKWKKWAEQFEE